MIFRELFKDSWTEQHVLVLRSDNTQELGSAEVQKIEGEEKNQKIDRHYLNPYEQFQDCKAEKCIGDCWLMTRAVLFSNTTISALLTVGCIAEQHCNTTRKL